MLHIWASPPQQPCNLTCLIKSRALNCFFPFFSIYFVCSAAIKNLCPFCVAMFVCTRLVHLVLAAAQHVVVLNVLPGLSLT